MSRVVFLLEERSMKVLLEGLLPRLVPDLPFLWVTHDGKGDLEKSIPRKLRAWREPGVRFVVVHDNDGADCRELKSRPAELCRKAGREDTLIRIPCQELEAWYFGEPEALAEAYESARPGTFAGKAGYRHPDAIRKPSTDLERLLPGFQKISGARKMGLLLSQEPTPRRVVLVGNKISPGNPVTKDDGTVVRTLWGELAWQLGGKPAYERLAADDERATSPEAARRRRLAHKHGRHRGLRSPWRSRRRSRTAHPTTSSARSRRTAGR